MFLLSIFLPFLSYLICILFNKKLKDQKIIVSSCAILVLSTTLSFLSLFNIYGEENKSIILTSWINSGSLSIDWSVQYNLLTSSMVLMINLVSSLIHIYSFGYMSKDERKVIFIGYLGLFTFLCYF